VDDDFVIQITNQIEKVAVYEKTNGRKLVKIYDNLGLVDFYSERFNGEERFIILTNKLDFMLSEAHIEDLNSIIDKTYVYLIKGEDFEEMKLTTSLFDDGLKSLAERIL
jgi:hypothetical protein